MARAGTKTAKYVYGVVRAAGRSSPRGKGIDGKPVRLVTSDGMGALVSDLPQGALEAGRDELLTHARVLRQALDRGTVLPMRFGVVMPDEDTVRQELLDAHRDELAAQLQEMDEKVEMNVKAFYDEATVLREVLAEHPDAAQLRDEVRDLPEDATYYARIRLGELIANALVEKRARDEKRILDRLAPAAVAFEAGDPVHEHMVVNLSFLLERDRLAAFDDALEQIAAEEHPRIGFRLTGPLPPHSFVELSVEA